MSTKIEWTHIPGYKGETWNPVTGCTKIAPGCKHCYAEGVANRFWGERKFTDVQTHPDRLDQPLRWRKPRCAFVNSMSDLFHEDVPFEFIAAVYGVMAASPDHLFLILTKRPERMREFFEWMDAGDSPHSPQTQRMFDSFGDIWVDLPGINTLDDEGDQCWNAVNKDWPLPNVWHGVSIATQADADKNIPVLLQVPSAMRFVSAEPLIEGVDLRRWMLRLTQFNINTGDQIGGTGDWRYGIDWLICGGESGPHARPFDIAWARSLRDQCKAAGVPFFLKQVGSAPCDDRGVKKHTFPIKIADSKGGNPEEWPADLRVREWPETAKWERA